MWAVTVMLYWLKLPAGILCGGLSVLWLVHIVLYVMLAPPLYPFLNTFFSKMDRVFPLFGTLAFSLSCFYLIGAKLPLPFKSTFPLSLVKPSLLTAQNTASLNPNKSSRLCVDMPGLLPHPTPFTHAHIHIPGMVGGGGGGVARRNRSRIEDTPSLCPLAL